MITTAHLPGTNSRWRIGMWSAFAALLAAPLIATQLTPEVRWTSFDFAAAAMMLGALGISVELVCREIIRPRARGAVLALLLAAALLAWAEGAVGVF